MPSGKLLGVSQDPGLIPLCMICPGGAPHYQAQKTARRGPAGQQVSEEAETELLLPRGQSKPRSLRRAVRHQKRTSDSHRQQSKVRVHRQAAGTDQHCGSNSRTATSKRPAGTGAAHKKRRGTGSRPRPAPGTAASTPTHRLHEPRQRQSGWTSGSPARAKPSGPRRVAPRPSAGDCLQAGPGRAGAAARRLGRRGLRGLQAQTRAAAAGR